MLQHRRIDSQERSKCMEWARRGLLAIVSNGRELVFVDRVGFNKYGKDGEGFKVEVQKEVFKDS